MRAKEIYDGHADLWVRNGPILLSDYSARPRVLELCGDVSGIVRSRPRVVEKGYVGPAGGPSLARHSVTGYDVSDGDD